MGRKSWRFVLMEMFISHVTLWSPNRHVRLYNCYHKIRIMNMCKSILEIIRSSANGSYHFFIFLLPDCCNRFLHNEFNFVLLLGNVVLICRLHLFNLVEVSRTLFKPQQYFSEFSNLICYNVLFYWTYAGNVCIWRK